MDKTERLFALLDALRRRRRPTTAETLAEEQQVSVRTIYRDVQTLIGLGAPIEGEAGLGYVLRPGFFMPPLMFSPVELEALVLGARWVQTLPDGELGAAARNALAKIATASNDDLRARIDDPGLWPINLAQNESKPRTPILERARQAMRRECAVELGYEDAEGRVTSRTIWPVQIAYYEQKEIVAAWCCLRGDYRVFRTDRIRTFELTAEPYGRTRAELTAECMAHWRREAGATGDVVSASNCTAVAHKQSEGTPGIVPLHFSESAEVPESQLHLDLRTLLYQLLSEHLGLSVTVGSDQCVYLDASNPKRWIAPDVYAKATPRGEPIRSWKVWERGAPDVAVEIVSDSDAPALSWEEKLLTYQALGIKELVRLDLVSGQAPLRVWNRTQEVLTERLIDDASPANGVASLVFNFYWVVAPAGTLPKTLRIATRLDPLLLVPSANEAVEAERRSKEAERQGKEAARARVAELEALLRSRQ